MAAAIGLLIPGGGALVVGGVALTTAAGTLTIAGTLVNLAGGLLLNHIANRLNAPSSVNTTAPAPANVQLTTRQLVGPRQKHYGEVRVGGQVVFFRANSGKFYRLVVHGHGEITAIQELLLDKAPVTLAANGYVTQAQYDVNSRRRVRILSRLGSDTSTYYPEIEAVWADYTPDHRLDGLWTSLLVAEQVPPDDFRAVYPHNEPTLELVAQTTKVLDPRTGQVGYSETAALVIADLIQSVDGFNLPGKVNLGQLARSADDSDSLVPLKAGGYEPRYRLSGTYALTEAPAAPLRRMLDACGGDVRLRPDGTIGIHVGVWEQPTVTLDTSDILELQEYSTGPDKLDRYSELPFSYVDRSLDHSEVTGDPWRETDLEGEYGGREPGPMQDFTFAPSHGQARRVAKQVTAKDNPVSDIVVRCKPKALRAFYERFVRLNVPEMKLNGFFRVRNAALDPANLTTVFTLRAIDASAFDWDKSEEGTPQTGSSVSPGAGIPVPGEFAASGWGIEGAPGVYSAGIAAAWAAAPSDALIPVLEYTLAGQSAWQKAQLGSAQNQIVLGGLTNGAQYDLRLVFEASDGARGAMVTLPNVMASQANAAPAAPTGLSVTDLGGGAAQIDVVGSPDPDVWQTEIYRDGSLVTSIFTGPSEAIQITDLSGAGTFAWTARTINVAGVASATDAGPANQTIT